VRAEDTFNEFKFASLPDMMTFFQLGILTSLLLVGYRIACPLPLRAYNIIFMINMKKKG
jgi:hypothetical protein